MTLIIYICNYFSKQGYIIVIFCDQIKENRRVGNLSAGPTSHLLEGVTWDEARRMQDASMSAATDHVILVGAASKGIIQRDFQHNAVVYKTPYAKNPFDAVTDQELEEYKELVERKQRGDPSKYSTTHKYRWILQLIL